MQALSCAIRRRRARSNNAAASPAGAGACSAAATDAPACAHPSSFCDSCSRRGAVPAECFLFHLGTYLRVLWRVDILSLSTVCFILALAALLPRQLSMTLLAFEAAFGLITVPRRCYRFDKCEDPLGPGVDDSEDSSSTSFQDGLHVLQQLLDPTEGHAELLRTSGTWFSGWWSGGVTAAELGHTNVAQFLSYIIFGGRLGEKTAHLLHQASDTFITTVGLDIGQDHNPQATFISHSEEPFKARYRPLTFYLFTEAVAGVSHVQLTGFQGFKLITKTNNMTFYMKQPAGASDEPPIVFLHGIGLGLAPYTSFLKRLSAQYPDRTIIAVQYRHVSMRLTTHIPTATEVADNVESFLSSLGIGRINLVAHSYGTLVASSLAKRHASILAGLTLIDPVCFAMFLPHLVCNTLHFDAKLGAPRAPAGRILSVRRLLKGLVLREMHCAAAMSRRFRWPELNLWTSEIPANTTIVLGGSDNMIPVADIKQLLSSPAAAAKGIKVLYTPEHGHGAFLMDPELQSSIVSSAAVAADGVESPEPFDTSIPLKHITTRHAVAMCHRPRCSVQAECTPRPRLRLGGSASLAGSMPAASRLLCWYRMCSPYLRLPLCRWMQHSKACSRGLVREPVQ